MACPSSGEITLRGLAREKDFDNYGSGSIPTGNSEAVDATVISLKDVSTSGYSHSTHVEFEATNTASASYPDGSTPYAMSEFYSYDHDAVALYSKSVYSTGVPKKVFACSQTTNATWYFTDLTPAINDYVYTDSGGSSAAPSGNYGFKNIGSGSTDYRFSVGGAGILTDYASCSPSDRRLKKNIKLIGYSPSGLKIYTFEYLNKLFGDGVFQGVMSDEIPNNAVIKNFVDIYDGVDYSKIDVEFKKI